MICRFFLKEYLSFSQIDCNFQNGLIIFSGPSGAGKSIFMNGIQSLFGNGDTKAKLSEITLENLNINDDQFCIEKDDDIIIKQTTSTKTRFFLNSQSISKKALQQFTKTFSKHLHLKDTSDFESAKIISFLDTLCKKDDKEFQQLKENFQTSYQELEEKQKALNKINQDEKNLDELIEFIKFEIEQISSIDPKVGEIEELKEFKIKLSKKDKLDEYIQNAQPLLDNSHHVSTLLHQLDIDSAFFDDAISEVLNHIETFNDSFEFIDDEDIEQTLTRIEQLSKLEKKYGSLEDAIEYKNQKEKELKKFDNISFEKAILEKNIKKLSIEIESLAKQLSNKRNDALPVLEDAINYYLQNLHLSNLTIIMDDKTLDKTGIDNIQFTLNNTPLVDISSGEFNRLRLALLTARSKYEINNNGILFLDEIDANLSGKESDAIAKLLKELSNYYQIFAISHQPQLSATADQHFLIYKEDNTSKIKELDKSGRINEIARIISGENITNEAQDFASKLLNEKS